MIPKRLHDVTEADLLALVEQEAEEGPQLDFKRELPKEDNDGKKEFFKDVCAFANTSGGDLVYGLEEKEGVARALVPQVVPGSIDGYVLKLTNMLRDRIEPMLHGVQIQPVPLAAGGHAVVVRVPRSFTGIHRSKADGQFYVRRTRSIDALDVPGIVSRVADHLGREDRVSSFFARRYADILSNEHSLELASGPKLVMHLVPARDFLSGEEVNIAAVDRAAPVPFLLDQGGSTARATWDGRAFFGAADGTALYFTLFMHSGVVETCRDLVPAFLPDQAKGRVDLEWVEDSVLGFLTAFQTGPWPASVTGFPYLIRVALLGANGFPATPGGRFTARGNDYGLAVKQPHPVLALPAVLIEGPESNVEHEMHAAFLRMWHAWGFSKSVHYELKDGLWTRRRYN